MSSPGSDLGPGSSDDGGTGGTTAADAHGDVSATGPGHDAATSSLGDAAPDGPGLDTPAVEQKVSALLAQMTLAEKVGQMVMADYGYLTLASDVTTYGLGAVLAGGDEFPGTNTPRTGSLSPTRCAPAPPPLACRSRSSSASTPFTGTPRSKGPRSSRTASPWGARATPPW